MMKRFFLILIVLTVGITIWFVSENQYSNGTETLTPTPTPSPAVTSQITPTRTISTVYTTPSIDPENNLYWATAYNTVLDSELDGTQTVSRSISGSDFSLKASFLFGGFGVSMQGIGKTVPGGTCIQHTSGGGSFIHIDDPLEFTSTVRNEYQTLGVTDFTGFGPLALSSPATSEYIICRKVTGSSDRVLIPWHSIATDPVYIPSGTKGTIIFQEGKPQPSGSSSMEFRADDTGSAIKGKRIDIYIGEGESALDQWYATGGNRYVEVYKQNGTFTLKNL